LQPLFQHRVWERFDPGEGPQRLAAVITELTAEDDRFSMEGGSWTSDISWMRGYENVLAPMERASSLFNAPAVSRQGAAAATPELPLGSTSECVQAIGQQCLIGSAPRYVWRAHIR
jgi:hypothetical protein